MRNSSLRPPVVKTTKLAQRVSNRLERDILNERLPVGHRLGTVPELLERYGVSRAVLREAIRLVERHQIVESRRGVGGGLFVSQPPRGAMASVLSGYLESTGLDISELYEARRAIEEATASFAAERVNHEGGQELKRIVPTDKRQRSPVEDAPIQEKFHIRIADLALSPALALFAQCLHKVAQDIWIALISPADYAKMQHSLWRAKGRIADAIIDADASLARRAMSEHLRDREAMLLGCKGSRPRRMQGDRPPGKLGESLARKITEEIRRKRWVSGRRLGSEVELIRSYGVGRPVFREAVRMLEQHGVAEMRRGIGGGLFVSDADPSEVVLSASVYLAHLKLDDRSLYEARSTLEQVAAARAAERASESDRQRLATALGQALSCSDHEELSSFRAVHTLIADLSKNRALSLFIRVLITTAWGDDAVHAPRPAAWRQALRGSHMRLVSAIYDGDSELARDAMEKHLALTRSMWIDAGA